MNEQERLFKRLNDGLDAAGFVALLFLAGPVLLTVLSIPVVVIGWYVDSLLHGNPVTTRPLSGTEIVVEGAFVLAFLYEYLRFFRHLYRDFRG